MLAVALVGALVYSRTGGSEPTAVVAAGSSSSSAAGAPSSTTPAGSGTTTTLAAGSVAGRPCVPVSDPLPSGAPQVPVEVGPPPTSLISRDLKVGTGAVVPAGATVTVNYIGVACSSGRIFDSSYSRNQTASFPLSNVIQGWSAGIPGMKIGGQRLLGIPASQAYGAAGRPPAIAPDEALWFVIEVLDSKPA